MPPHGASKSAPQSSIPRKRPADTQEEAWVADEDRFVLRQAKKKATLRARAGRAKPVDLLAVTLRAIDGTVEGFESDEEGEEPMLVNPEHVFESLDGEQLDELEKGIDTYLALENTKKNRDFWNTMKLICNDRRQTSQQLQSARGISSVASELDRVLGPKNLEDLETLEKQVKHKLRTDDSIDVDYWETLLKRLLIHKAKAKLRKVSQSVINARLEGLRKAQEQDAALLQSQLLDMIDSNGSAQAQGPPIAPKPQFLDPEPSLKVGQADRVLAVLDAAAFLKETSQDRRNILKAGFIPVPHGALRQDASAANRDAQTLSSHQNRPTPGQDDGHSRTTSALYDREAARGVGDDEEVFAGEEDVQTARKPEWADKYRPRKPRYFNRVQMGYEWNKYNQTHYDHDNPPPKVVQGYKFNVFYPDLIDKVKAPTYRIERENGRKRGQSFAPAGEEDNCLIRFVAGPPYEDIAFRIVDKEWDYSAKRERGFKSSFDKGILQLHFQFKKIYYRK